MGAGGTTGRGEMDPNTLGELIERHAAALELFARQWTLAPEDAVQDAFVSLAGLANPPRNPSAWLFRAVRNAAINAGIAGRRRRVREAEAAAIARPWFDPEGNSADLDPIAAQEALAALPDDQREVIVAHLWGGLSFEQVADVVGSSASTVHRRYHAGLAAIRTLLGESCTPSRRRANPN